jgi:hypothetical protein
MVMIHSLDEKESLGVISITRITGRSLRITVPPTGVRR